MIVHKQYMHGVELIFVEALSVVGTLLAAHSQLIGLLSLPNLLDTINAGFLVDR